MNVDLSLVFEFLQNIRECDRCGGCDEGCSVCGIWYPYANPYRMAEYQLAHAIYNSVAVLTDMTSNESWKVKLYDVRIMQLERVDDHTFNGICYYEYAGDEPVYFVCKLN